MLYQLSYARGDTSFYGIGHALLRVALSSLAAARVSEHRQELQARTMARSHRAEVTTVERCELRFTESFDDRQHGRIDEADIEIAIAGDDLFHADVVVLSQILQCVTARSDVAQHRGEGVRAEVRPAEVIQLGKHGGRDHTRLARIPDEPGADVVMSIAGVKSGKKWPGV